MEQTDASRTISGWHLGQTSERFESPGSGPGSISTGSNDRGGVSYGAYQLSSKTGTVHEYLTQSTYGSQFQGLVPATPAFDERWRKIAATDTGFGRDQQNFIGRSHYQAQLRRLDGMDFHLEGRGRAVQDALWSTSVQFRDLTPKIVVGALRESFGAKSQVTDLTDSQIVGAIQDYKTKHNEDLFKSSPGLWRGLLKRANAEKAVLQSLAEAETLLKTGSPVGAFPNDWRKAAVSKLPDQSSIERQQAQLSQLGYGGTKNTPVTIDGQLGPDTIHAIKSFQQAHHLHPDGVAGPHTLAALDEAKRYPLLSEATNPHHRIYQEVLDGIHKLPHGQQPKGQHLVNTAVALTLSAQASGLHQVDHVVLGTNGVNLFAVQGRMDDPGHRRVQVELAHVATHVFDHQPMPQPAQMHAQAIAAVHLQSTQRGPLMAGP